MQRLESESSNILKEFITEQHIDYQLTPSSLHQRNWDKRAIQTFNNHFLAGLCSTYPNLPLNLWCKLVAQYIIIPNLLQYSQINTNLSSHAQIFVNFNYERTPIDTPVLKFFIMNVTNIVDHGLHILYLGGT